MSNKYIDNIGKCTTVDVTQAWTWALSNIVRSDIREYTKSKLELLPEQFYTRPASSTGKYHPVISRGKAGLYRHVMLAFKIGLLLKENCQELYGFTPDEWDIALSAILLHDNRKYGVNFEQKNCPHEHPLLGADQITDTGDATFDKDIVVRIRSAVASHSGKYIKSGYSDIVLPLPSNRLEWFVHQCDLLSGQKYFDTDEIDIEKTDYYTAKVDYMTEPQKNYAVTLSKKNSNYSLSTSILSYFKVTKSQGSELIQGLKDRRLSIHLLICKDALDTGYVDDWFSRHSVDMKIPIANYIKSDISRILIVTEKGSTIDQYLINTSKISLQAMFDNLEKHQ